jgi:L-threonylcarbamoyladenylate synthase
MTAELTTEILPTHTPALFAAAVRRAAELLRAGEVVALPTETVYGLAANAFNSEAVAAIYEIKGRPSRNPVIVHVDGLEMARDCALEWPPIAARLARSFWPGPLTLVLPRSARIPDVVTAGGPTVAIRWPSHPIMQAVIGACGFPLAAPSANLSNRLSPTSAEHVRKQLGDRIPLIVDGGPSQVGIESAVLDLTTAPPHVLRPGMIGAESLAAVVGEVESGRAISARGEALRSPGALPRHYAPIAELLVLRWRDISDLESQLSRLKLDPSATHVVAHTQIPRGGRFRAVSIIPHEAQGFARALYAELHRCDDQEARWIVVEAPPEGAEWRAVADRLARAGHKDD